MYFLLSVAVRPSASVIFTFTVNVPFGSLLRLIVGVSFFPVYVVDFDATAITALTIEAPFGAANRSVTCRFDEHTDDADPSLIAVAALKRAGARALVVVEDGGAAAPVPVVVAPPPPPAPPLDEGPNT